MSKYQPLSDRLSGHEGPEWEASFAEIEEVLGFPLPKGAKAGRAWWADADKAHARSWSRHGFAAHPDPTQARVTFRRSAAAERLGPGGTPEAQLKPKPSLAPSGRAELSPDAASGVEVTASPGGPPKANVIGPAALVAAGLALVAGVGALLMKTVGRRA